MKSHYITALPDDWMPAARVFAALGDPMRQRILLLFEPGDELSIKTIVESFTLSRSAMVHHLNVLEQAGILQVRREGKAALYSVRPQVVLEALDNLRLYIYNTFPEESAHARPHADE